MRVTCGGWHRPFTFHCLSPTKLVFIHHQPRTSDTHVHRRCPTTPLLVPAVPERGLGRSRGGAEGSFVEGGAAAEPVTGLHAVHHGREILCCALLPSIRSSAPHAVGSNISLHQQTQLSPHVTMPVGQAQSPAQDCISTTHQQPRYFHSSMDQSEGQDEMSGSRQLVHVDSAVSPLCLLTGSEDGTMRQLLYSPQPADDRQQRQSSSEQSPSGNGHGQSTSGQTGSGNGQNQSGKGQTESYGGETPSGNEQSEPSIGRRQAACIGQSQGLFGADEVGFQAAGSAVKSIITIPAEPGMYKTNMNLNTEHLKHGMTVICRYAAHKSTWGGCRTQCSCHQNALS